MNEELQNKLIAAIEKLASGTPKAWEVLVEEFVRRNIMSGLICIVIIGLLGLIATKIFIKTHPEKECDEIVKGIGTVCIALIIIVMVFAIYHGLNLASPNLSLMKDLLGR